MEVKVLSLVRERTSIPVPVIYSWGLAADNPLDLGAIYSDGVHRGRERQPLSPGPQSRCRHKTDARGYQR